MGLEPGRMGDRKGRRKRKERKVGVLKGCEAVEIGGGGGELRDKAQYFAIDKRVKVRKPRKKGAGAGNARYGKRGVWTPMPPPPPTTIADGY